MTPDERAELVELWRQRQVLIRTEGDMTRRIYALARRVGKKPDDPIVAAAAQPFESSRVTLRSSRKSIEVKIRRLVRTDLTWSWAKTVKGLAELGVGSLIAEAGGDLLTYPTHSKLWKRMGLAVSEDGRAQRRKRGAAGELEGFSPHRRAVSYNVAVALFRIQSQVNGPYRNLYDDRRRYEESRVDNRGHAHARAMRYMEKRMLRDLWRSARQNHGGQ